MMTKPIRPSQLQPIKKVKLPDEVFEVFNQLIRDNWNGKSAVVMQEEAAKRIAKALGIEKISVFDRAFLDVEDAYRKVGWKVLYDKPGFNEDYEAKFKFSK
jgi:hypothetical protein